MFFTSIILLLFSTELISADKVILNQLVKVEFDRKYSFTLTSNEPTVLLLEIFSPTSFLSVNYSKRQVVNALQASIFIPKYSMETIHIRAGQHTSYFWYRVINTMDVVPRFYPSTVDFQMKATMKNNWYTSIEFVPAKILSKDFIVPIKYDIWSFPIFPNGQVTSWGLDVRLINQDLIMAKINSSLDSSELKQKGFLITSLPRQSRTPLMQFTIPNRKTYTNLIIINAVFNDSFSMQYSPVIIYGCAFDSVLSSVDTGTSRWSPDDRCYLMDDWAWNIIIIVLVTTILLFTLIGFFCENLLSLIFTWLFLSYIFCIGFHYIFWDINSAGNNLYFMICGICPGISLFISIFNCCACSTKSRLRIIFNILCLVAILYHVFWFIFQTFLSDYKIVLGVISGVSIILFFLFLYFYEIMITFGNVFISASMALCGISLLAVKSSSFPYLFLDFFNYILYKDSHVKYYTYLLIDDMLLLVSLGLSLIFIGCLSYKIYQIRYREENPNSVKPADTPQVVTLIATQITVANYGAFSTQSYSNNLEPRLSPHHTSPPRELPPPRYTPRATAPPLP